MKNGIKTHLVIILSYGLIFANSCKKTTRTSNVADVPTSKTAYEGIEGESESEKTIDRFVNLFKSTGFEKSLPMVVVDYKNRTKTKATPAQIADPTTLAGHQEMFFGSPESKYVAGMKVLPSRSEKSKTLNFALNKYSTENLNNPSVTNRKSMLTLQGGDVFKFSTVKDKNELNSELNSMLEQTRNFLYSSFGDEMKQATDSLAKRKAATGKKSDELIPSSHGSFKKAVDDLMIIVTITSLVLIALVPLVEAIQYTVLRAEWLQKTGKPFNNMSTPGFFLKTALRTLVYLPVELSSYSNSLQRELMSALTRLNKIHGWAFMVFLAVFVTSICFIVVLAATRLFRFFTDKTENIRELQELDKEFREIPARLKP